MEISIKCLWHMSALNGVLNSVTQYIALMNTDRNIEVIIYDMFIHKIK